MCGKNEYKPCGDSNMSDEENQSVEQDENVIIDPIAVAGEIEELDQTIDNLNSCLDHLESWSDSLNSKMREFIETMRKDREERQNQVPTEHLQDLNLKSQSKTPDAKNS
ncbi:UPF0184 protein [Trichoplax sp. H2]|nr:UPF0184 protein [Trichoplax sp. H2]|eukprot:RDD43448.1 UPF0184 protein [Trichoplax sp. H2]